MEYWKAENLMYINTDEFKYLSKIDEVINESKYITNILKDIKNNERFNIQKGSTKDMANFAEIKDKLTEIYKIINEL